MVLPNVGWHSVDSIPVSVDSCHSQLVLKTVVNCHVSRGARNVTGCETVSFITSVLLYGDKLFSHS